MFVCSFFFFVYLEFSCVFGPPHLALNPPYFCLFLGDFFLFPFFAFNTQKKPLFPYKRASLFIFQCLTLFLLSLSFGLPLLHILVLCFFFSLFLSLSLSLSLACSFLSSILLVFFFVSFFWFLVFVSLFFFLLGFCLMKRTRPNYSITKFFSSIIFLYWGFPVLFSLSDPFFLSFLFSWFYVVFLFQHECKKWVKRGCNKMIFLINLCFAKCEKLSFPPPTLFGKFWLRFQKHYKTGISAHF